MGDCRCQLLEVIAIKTRVVVNTKFVGGLKGRLRSAVSSADFVTDAVRFRAMSRSTSHGLQLRKMCLIQLRDGRLA